MKRGAKLLVKGCDGSECGPFKWTTVREWVTIGYFTPEDEVRLDGETAWCAIGSVPELLTPPPGEVINEALDQVRSRAGEKKAVGPRAAAYLKRLSCPVRPERLNPYTALLWIRILEEHHPALADANEHWAAEEEASGRVPAVHLTDATPEQIAALRASGQVVPENLTRLEAQRLISGPPTDGQRRRLEFYGITLPAGASKDEAAELIDRHMRDNWAAEEAYQASRRRVDPEGDEGKKLLAALRLRPVPKPAIEEDDPYPAVRWIPPPPPLPSPASEQPPVGRRKRLPTPLIYLVGAALVAGGILFMVWSGTRQRTGADGTETLPAAAPASLLERTVTLLEAPNRTLGEELRKRVMALELTGIIGGSEPRAMIAGRMYRVGDAIDPPRGVVVLQVDVEGNTVVFGDGAGNIVRRVLE